MSKRRTTAIALAWTLAGALAAGTSLAGDANGASGVPYLSGGFGSGEREQLEKRAAGYNLLVEIADRSGAFEGGGHVTIRDASGKTVLDTEVDGPQLYAKLPPGRYSVLASDGGAESGARTVEVPASGRATVVLDVAKRRPER